ncbi:MAG: hypothetical protein WBA23_09840 [Tunicatimonas sp.]|uniref:hypothetical protein n=1 Tax=Tunicatimonas sp. TaxID=1940096 RepID=UPI003C78D98F
MIRKFTFFHLIAFSWSSLLLAQSSPQKVNVIKVYDVEQAHQAVAVDDGCFYVINNTSITKHDKENGNLIKDWHDQDSVLVHLNSGIILDDKLYSCHSNYPQAPMASSIEIFDPQTLEHIDSHSLGIQFGSATWLDRYQDHWYVAFAHYTGRGSEPGKDNRWTQLVQFTDDWQPIAGWVFPSKLLERFASRSNSGGVIRDDGSLLITGHDEAEIYVMQFPNKGYTLRWVDTLPVGSFGQGIDCEEKEGQTFVYGIVREENQVVVTKLP